MRPMIDNIRNRNLWILLNKIWKTNFFSFNNVSKMNYRESAFRLQWTWTFYKYTAYRNEKFRLVKRKKFFYNTAIFSRYQDHLT